MQFPFKKIRPGQKQFYEDALRSIDQKKVLLSYAPTGIGKTAAVLGAAVKKQLEDRDGLVFFLTSRHSQHSIAVETLKKIQEANDVEINVVDIVNKKDMCPLGADMGRMEFESYCYSMKRQGTCKYGRVNPLAVATLEREVFHVEEAVDISKKFGSCPYFTALSRLKTADVVICDYSYIFDPQIRSVIVGKAMKSLEDFIVIVDEAHNLPLRVREYGTYSLTTGLLGASKKLAKEILRDKLLANQINVLMKTLKTDKESEITKSEVLTWIDEAFYDQFIGDVTYSTFLSCTETAAERLRELTNDPLPNVLDSVSSFFKIWNENLQDYVRIMDSDGIHMVPLNVALISSEVFDKARSTILMSATLYPQEMYANILGIENPIIKSYDSPFPESNRLVVSTEGLSSAYKNRGPEMFRLYAKKIDELSKEVPGNVAVFFPSYDLMNSILEHLNTKRKIIVETSDWKKEKKSSILKIAKEKENILFCFVQGASFFEGVDFKNNSLKSIIIAGLPISPPSVINQRLLDFYDYKFGKGYEYVYLLPAFNKVLQSAGRGIRSPTDICSILLLDSRFNYLNYKKFIPNWKIKKSAIPLSLIKDFYGGRK
ncbi:ATP-dependent DNA helicase [Candidatus Micrarchaeota archaeon]|nr:ATP-dependent DNA helicase [Candidatus Micrarchaeota archaeon]